MAEVKYQHIINETVRNKFFDITNIKKLTATRYLTFICKVARNPDNHLPNKLITVWCNYKRRRGGALRTNKKSIVHNLRLIVPLME